jgi:hypothetical protein
MNTDEQSTRCRLKISENKSEQDPRKTSYYELFEQELGGFEKK